MKKIGKFYLFVFLLFSGLFVLSYSASAAGCAGTGSCYWVGGNGNTNSTTHWATTSGGSTTGGVPTATDNCIIDQNSNATAYTITFNAATACKSISFAAPGTSGNVTLAATSALNLTGTWTGYSGLINNYTGTITFNGAAGPYTLTSAGVAFGSNITINTTGAGTAGQYNLADNLALGSSNTLTLTQGDLEASGYNITTGSFSSSNSNTRTITMGSGTWTLTGNATTIWNTGTVTGLTFNNGNAIVSSYSGSTGTRTINTGSISEASAPTFNITAGSDTVSLSGNVTTLNFTGFTGTFSGGGSLYDSNFTIVSGMTVSGGSATTFAATSGTYTITTNGVTLSIPITFNGVGGTWNLAGNLTMGSADTLTLTNGTFNANGYNVTTGIFSSSNSNTRTITMGSGTWTLTGNNTTIWNTGTTTNLTFNNGNAIVCNYSGSTGTRTIAPGSLALGTAPSFNITAGSDIITTSSGSHFGSLNFTGFSGTLTNVSKTLYGSLAFSSGMTATSGTNTITFAATSGTNTITTNGVTVAFPITFNGVGGAWQLGSNLTDSTGNISISNGTLNLAGSNINTGATLTVFSGATLELQGGETVTTTNEIFWLGSNVIYNGTGTYNSLAAGNSYGNLTFNGSGSHWTLGAPIYATNTLTIGSGVALDASSSNYGVTVAGWSNSGTFIPRQGTLTFINTATLSDPTTFYNVTINSQGGRVTLGAPLNVANNLTISPSGTLDASSNNYSIIVGGSWINSSGASWTTAYPDGNVNDGYLAIACDSTCTNLIGGTYAGRLWISHNSGVTWTETQPAGNNNENWETAASDSTGTNLIAGAYSGRLYISNNSGSSWTETQPAGNNNENWISVASSSDGTHLIAAVSGGRLYISSNSGVSWSETQPAGNANESWATVTSDFTGTNLIAGVNGGRLYISNNSGSSWSETQPAGNNNENWGSSASSSDGTHLIVGDDNTTSGGRLYISNNSGSSWTETQPMGNNNESWRSAVASSADGTHLIAGGYNTGLYISSNFGTSWTETYPNGIGIAGWQSVASSADGSHLAISPTGGGDGGFSVYSPNNVGTFIPRQGTVTLNGTGQSITGSTTFYNLTKSVTSADTLTFQAGSTQTVSGTLTLNGATSNILSLVSSIPGTQWNVNPSSAMVSYVNTQDSDNTNSTPISLSLNNSVNSGNNTNWDFISSDATLSSFSVSLGTLSPTFTSATTSYSDSVGNSVTTVTITPTLDNSNATIAVNGGRIASGSALGPIAMNVGSNTVSLVVTAQDGVTQKTYTLTVIRAGLSGHGVVSALGFVHPTTLSTSIIASTPAPSPTPIPTQTPSIIRQPLTNQSSFIFTRYLDYGDPGQDVLMLQKILLSLGFFPSTISPNGNYGPTTRRAVQLFQKAHGIKQTGSVGPATKAVLNGLY